VVGIKETIGRKTTGGSRIFFAAFREDDEGVAELVGPAIA
jgi:hypothetical protein